MTANHRRPQPGGQGRTESLAGSEDKSRIPAPREPAQPVAEVVEILADTEGLGGPSTQRHLNAPAVPPLAWSHQFEVALAVLIRSGQEIDVDAIRDLGVPEPLHSCHWGHAVHRAARRGDIVSIGARRSRRPERHSALIRIWVAAATAPPVTP